MRLCPVSPCASNSSASASGSRAVVAVVFRLFQVGGGMRCRVGLAQDIDRHARIELRGSQIDVPEHLLNDLDVGTFSSMSVATPLAKRCARAADCGTRDLDLPWANCASRAD